MKNLKYISINGIHPLVLFILSTIALFGCSSEKPKANGISPQKMADALHAIMEADRTVYTQKVVNRLMEEEQVIDASEHWQDDKALPLPAQMFRMGAEIVSEQDAGFTYALLSMWAINKQNSPQTDAEKVGLKHVVDNPSENYYTEEKLGGKTYFTAIYADIAVAQACVECHNSHQDSPRSDFEMGDVMGGIVVRIPLN